MDGYRGSLPQEKTEFITSIAMTIDEVSSFLPSLLPSFLSSFFSLYFLAFVSFCVFYFDDCLSETNSLSETKILKMNGIHLKHRGEDKGELDLLVQSLMETMQMRKG